MNAIQRFDEAAMLAVRRLQREPFIFFFRLLTWSGTGKTWFVLAVGLNMLHRSGARFIERQVEFLQAMPCSLLAYVACIGLKRLIERKRPPNAIPNYTPLARNPSCGSFPSGHAAAAFAFYVALLMLGHPAAHAVGAWALLVSFSRYYLGVHFPTDLLGGALVGLACGLLVRVVQRALTF